MPETDETAQTHETLETGGRPPVEAPPTLRVPRPDESTPADEMTMARAWLTHLRESVILKLEDLDHDQLRWRPAPTANSLGSIATHLGYAERLWVRAVFAGEEMDMSWRQHMFELPDDWSVDDVVGFYRAESAAVDDVLDRATSFDLPSAAPIRPTTLRWVVLHLIEETARHAGHMDITRELLDGRTGR
ncbi:MAG: DinB family protein [Acidimicrobiales bacterium]